MHPASSPGYAKFSFKQRLRKEKKRSPSYGVGKPQLGKEPLRRFWLSLGRGLLGRPEEAAHHNIQVPMQALD